MQAGELNTKIIIQQKTKGTGPYADSTYTDYKTVYAKWIDINSIEVLKSDTTQSYCYATVTIRKLAGLSATCKIKKNNSVWDIIGEPKVLENRAFIEFKVQKAVAG